MGGVTTPNHMDGKSFLPLLRNGHRNVKSKWPDTFLIESSGRRETPEQIAEQKARAAAAAMAVDLKESTGTTSMNGLHYGSHEEEGKKWLTNLKFFNDVNFNVTIYFLNI